MKKLDPTNLLPLYGKDCDRCLDLVIKIRRGEIKGVVLSCHPLDQIAEPDIAQYIKSQRLEK